MGKWSVVDGFNKTHLTIGTFFEYDESDIKVEKEMFIYNGYVKITREFDSDVFVKRILKQLKRFRLLHGRKQLWV